MNKIYILAALFKLITQNTLKPFYVQITVAILFLCSINVDAQISFQEIMGTPFEGVIISSITYADIDGDNDQDVLITGLNPSNERIAKLYTNDGSGSFTLVSGTPFDGVFYGSIAFADIDGDNDQDVLITGQNISNERIAKLYTNDGSGGFTLVSGTPFDGVLASSSIAFADIDSDNDQDVLITGQNISNERIAKLYTNDGSGGFTLVSGTPFEGAQRSSIAFADIDGDNDQDVLITGLNPSGQQTANLYTNDGSGSFTLVSGTPFDGVFYGSIAFADIDGDNDQDVLITGRNASSQRIAKLYTNDGSGGFTLVPGTSFDGVGDGSIAFADIDGDNDQDVLITGQNISNERIAKLYRNTTTEPGPTITCAADITSECGDDIIVTPPTVSDNNYILGSALNFDGTNEFVVSPIYPAINNNFTVEMWVNPTATHEIDPQSNSNTTEGVSGQRYALWPTNSANLGAGHVGMGISVGTNGVSVYEHGADYVPSLLTYEGAINGWTHVSVVYINKQPSLYINGILAKTGLPSTKDFVHPSALQIGSGPYGSFIGDLDEFRIWDFSRNEIQIESDYLNSLNGSETGLFLYYDFKEGTGSPITNDQSQNGFTAVLVNMDPSTDWIGSIAYTNNFNNTADASGTYPVGDTTVIWTVTDDSGNMATCEQTVTVAPEQLTWNGSVSSDWDTPNNWTPNVVPSQCSEVTFVTANTATISGVKTIKNLNINSGSSVTVPVGATLNVSGDLIMSSVSNAYAGLVGNGTISVAGTAKYKRYTNSQLNDNDLISPPLDGQSWSSFLTSDSNYNASILFTDGVAEPNTTYLFGPFEKSDTDDYLVYNYNDTVTLDSGKGYRVATNTAANDGNGEPLIFTGSILTGSVDAAIENDITGNFHQWNLIGNPYPAYIDVNTFFNHVGSVSGVTNLSLLDDSTAAIYGYDADETDTTESNWTITNLVEGAALIAPGQGFFVSSKNASATLEFTTAMQVVGNSDDFIEGRTSQPTDFIKLKATTATNSSSISVYFHESASAGLDVGYDAAVFGGSVSEFGLYSHLVQDNEGIPIAIQTLNTDAINNVIIPLGMHTNQGQQLTFSLEDSHLPASVEVYLEDTLTNTFTLLNTSSYTLTPSTNLSDTGRFFLRFTAKALSIGTPSFNTINIYSNQSERSIIIEGVLQRETEVAVYDLLGRKVLQQGLDAALNKHTMNASTLSSGVYVVALQDANEQLTKKVIIK
jgi:hypothetical protein